MNELAVHPNVYATGGSTGLVSILERVWLREQEMGDGTFYIVSGFANYNGGVRFFPVFRRHINHGGRVVAIFGGNARQRLTSRQVVQEMLECGADVHVVNRKRLMHAKSYGSRTPNGEMLVVTSGNFTGPGMATECGNVTNAGSSYYEVSGFLLGEFGKGHVLTELGALPTAPR